MSFSSKVKEEICRLNISERCCLQTELIAIIRNSAVINIDKNNIIEIKIITENAVFARKIFMILKSLYGYNAEVVMRKNKKLKKNIVYILKIVSKNVAEDILKKSKIKCKLENERTVVEYNLFYKEIIGSICCKRAYIRGAFLAAGSLSEPEKNYHLEIVSDRKMKAVENNAIIECFDLSPKIVFRKEHYVSYLKDSENIVDFLNIIFAHRALMELENIRVVKDMRNNVNRIVNCETANLQKIVNTAVRQVEDIKYIEKYIKIESLPENLKRVAYLRLDNKDVTLKELGMMMEPPLSKSGINHRLKKIELIANNLRIANGEIEKI